MRNKTLFFALVLASQFAPQLTAYDPDRRDNTLYDKNQYEKDWYYRDKWRYDKDAYLEGANQPLPPPPMNGNSQQADAYYNGRHYVKPNQRDQVIYGEDLLPAWDYRDNWRYNRDAYLSGNNRPYHYPDIEEYQSDTRAYYYHPQNNGQYYNGQYYNGQYYNGQQYQSQQNTGQQYQR